MSKGEFKEMKKASNIMYLLSIIFGIIALAFYTIFGIVGLTGNMPADITAELAKTWGSADLNAVWTFFVVEGVLGVLSVIFVFLAKKQVNNSNGHIALQIVAIVFGAAASSVFAVLGGIFGIISIKQNQ